LTVYERQKSMSIKVPIVVDEKLKSYVSNAADNLLDVIVLDQEIVDIIEKLGFNFVDTSENVDSGKISLRYRKIVKTEKEKANLMSHLRNVNIPFSYGGSWSPTEVFEYLREKNLTSGKYKEVSWRNRNDYIIRIIE
jgi:hypothetical protein